MDDACGRRACGSGTNRTAGLSLAGKSIPLPNVFTNTRETGFPGA